ncbi:uncharacterized protein UBRO2_02252 [Ustilago bromivora]|uniref:BTB domain-containing protein n=1 Tax=Ustilago bromivora TaxID=307758 RepID=A0A8H8QKJ5_9BASI|nr:uncharacterized protein UBRO2_02252 [Ustilago bromivora]
MLHDCEGKTYWVAHDILYGGRGGPETKYDDDLEATSPEAHYDRSAETGLYVSFRDGTLEVTLHVTEGSCGNIHNFKKRSRRLDVCISGYVGASTYFDTLFESDFAEASNLRRVQPHADKEQALKRQEEDRVEISGTMGSNTIPTINVDDISYKQLQTLVYYLYTGVAVFEKRRNLLVSSGKGESSTDASKPWWNGHLRPANAFDMYRLADKYGIEGLRIAALQYITSEISIEDLIKDAEMCEEISLFPEIAQVYKEFCECLLTAGTGKLFAEQGCPAQTGEITKFADAAQRLRGSQMGIALCNPLFAIFKCPLSEMPFVRTLAPSAAHDDRSAWFRATTNLSTFVTSYHHANDIPVSIENLD